MNFMENLADNPVLCSEEGTTIIQRIGISYGNKISGALHIFKSCYTIVLGAWQRDVSWEQITEEGTDWDILRAVSHEEIADIAHDMTPDSTKDWWINYKGIKVPITIHLFSNEVEFP